MRCSIPHKRLDFAERNSHKRFFLLEGHPEAPDEWPPYDPWPVRQEGVDRIAQKASDMVNESNLSSVEHFSSWTEILPASGTIHGVQGGQKGAWLYSIRSATRLPIRFHLWMRPDGKLMVIVNQQRMSFSDFLHDFRHNSYPSLSSQIYYYFTNIPEEALKKMIACMPPHLREPTFAKWRSFNNAFRFLDIPQEIRENIIIKALRWPKSRIVEAYKLASCFRDRKRNMALLMTCKQVYAEARSIMYTRTTIWFRGDMNRFSRFFESFPEESQPSVHSIIIDYDCFDLMWLFDLPNTLMEHLETGQQWIASNLPFEPPHRFDYLQKPQHLIIKVPHLREMHDFMCDHTDDAAWPCQNVFFRWLWAGIRPLARHIDKVEFQGHIDGDLNRDFQLIMTHDREFVKQGVIFDPKDDQKWQNDIWVEQ